MAHPETWAGEIQADDGERRKAVLGEYLIIDTVGIWYVAYESPFIHA